LHPRVGVQGKTIHRIILSVSEHLFHLNKMTWEGLYVALSRVRMGDHIRLLIKRGDWSTVHDVSKLRKNKYTNWYFKGYEDHPDGDGRALPILAGMKLAKNDHSHTKTRRRPFTIDLHDAK
jgi:hypothetical protein